MADQEESIDSRTSIGGRKRGREASFESGEISPDAPSGDETFNISRKRVRQDEELDVVATSSDHGVALNVASVEDVGMQARAPPIATETRTIGWNKGVQGGGIRTSFGAKKQSKQLFQLSSAEEVQPTIEPAAVHLDIASLQKPEKRATENESSPDLRETRPSIGEFTDSTSAARQTNVPQDVPMTGVAMDGTSQLVTVSDFNFLPPRPVFREQNADFQTDPPNTNHRPQPPILQDAARFYGDANTKPETTPVFPMPAPPTSEFPRNTGESAQQTYSAPAEIQPTPASTTAQRRAVAAPKKPLIPTEVPKLTEETMRAAVLAIAKVQGLDQTEIKRVTTAFSNGNFTKRQIALYRRLGENPEDTIDVNHVQLFEAGIAKLQNKKDATKNKRTKKQEIREAAKQLKQNPQKFTSQNSEPIIINDSDSEQNDEVDNSSSYHTESPLDGESAQWNAINAPTKQTNEERLANLSEAELLLQLKYFPTEDGKLYISRCLFCTEFDHATYDCPAASCTACGENSEHSTMSCPKGQRCGRCRELGHPATNCPSKLARSRSEAVPCDLCGSRAHIESKCQMIWRSFFPQPEEIITVRSFPMDCYTCGSEGHLGPECGLYQGPGNMTWSYANYKRYVNNSSTIQVVSAGVDYTIKSKAKKTFTIKGKANDPINLDDSDDDRGFIQPKVKTLSAPKGQIQFGNLQPPSGPRRNPGRGSRPDVSVSSYDPGPSRNGAPPRFPEHGSQNPPPQYQPYEGDRQGGGQFQNSYRPAPQPGNQPAPKQASKKQKRSKAKKGQQGGPSRR